MTYLMLKCFAVTHYLSRYHPSRIKICYQESLYYLSLSSASLISEAPRKTRADDVRVRCEGVDL